MTGEPQCILILDQRAGAFRSAEQTNEFLCMECREENRKGIKGGRLHRFFSHLAEVNPKVFSRHGLGRNRYR